MRLQTSISVFILCRLIQRLVNATECLRAKRFSSACHSSSINGFFFLDSSDQLLISYSTDSNLIMWELSKNRAINQFIGHKQSVADALVYQNEILYSISVNGQIIEFNLSTGLIKQEHEQIELNGFLEASLIVTESGIYSIYIDKEGQRINLYNIMTKHQQIHLLEINLQQSQLVSIFLLDVNKLQFIYSNGLLITFNLLNQSGYEVEDLKTSISQVFHLKNLNNSFIMFSKQFSLFSLRTDKSVMKIRLSKEGRTYEIQNMNIEQVFYLNFGEKIVIKTPDNLIISSFFKEETMSIFDQIYNLNIKNKYSLQNNTQIKQMIEVENKCELFFSTFIGILGRIVCGAQVIEYIDTQTAYQIIYFLIKGDLVLFTSENANIGIQIYSLSKKEITHELRCLKEPFYTTNETPIPYFDAYNNTINLATSQMIESYQTITNQCSKFTIQEQRQRQVKNILINDSEALIFTLDDTYFNVYDYFVQKLLITYIFNITASQTWLFENKQLRKSYACNKINGYIYIVEFDYQTKSFREISKIQQYSLVDSILFFNTNQNIFIHSDILVLNVYKITLTSTTPQIIYQRSLTAGNMIADYETANQLVYTFIISNQTLECYSLITNKVTKTMSFSIEIYDAQVRIQFKYYSGYMFIASPTVQLDKIFNKMLQDYYKFSISNNTLTRKYNFFDYQNQYIKVSTYLYIIDDFTIHQYNYIQYPLPYTSFKSDYIIKSAVAISSKQLIVFVFKSGGFMIANYDFTQTELVLPSYSFINYLFHPEQNIIYIVKQSSENDQASLGVIPYYQRNNSIYLNILLYISPTDDLAIFEVLGIIVQFSKVNGQVLILSLTSWKVLKQFSINECGFNVETIQTLFVKLNQITFYGKIKICVIEFLNPFSKINPIQFYRITKVKEIDMTKINFNFYIKEINIVFFLKCISTDSSCTLLLMKDDNLEIINEISGLPNCNVRMQLSDIELIVVSTNPKILNEKMKIIFINYTLKQQQIQRYITLNYPIYQIERINKEFFYIFDTSSNILIYSLKNFEIYLTFNIKIENSGQFYFDYTNSNYLVLDSVFSIIQIGKLDIQLKTIELQHKIPTCISPQEMLVLKGLDLFAVLCSQVQIFIHQLQNGDLVTKYQQNIGLFSKMYYIQSFNQMLFIRKEEKVYPNIYNIPSILTIPEYLNLEKNKFIVDYQIFNSQYKYILYATKSNFIYTYQLEKFDIQISLQLSSKVRRLQSIGENLVLVECFEQIIIWDHKQQIEIASFSFSSNQIDITKYSINSEEILITLYLLTLPNKFQSIDISINNLTNQTSLNVTQKKQFSSSVIQVIHIKESKFFIITTTDFKIYVQSYSLENVSFSQSLSSQIFNTIIIQQIQINQVVTQIIFLIYYKSIIQLYCLQYQISNVGVQNSFTISLLFNQQLGSNQNPISTIKFDISWFLVSIKDNQTLYFYDIQKNEKGILYALESQILLPFRRVLLHFTVNKQYNYLLVNADYSFIIYDMVTKLPIFQHQDNTFLENLIVDMVILNQSTLIVSTINNLFIIQISFDNFFRFISSSYEILFKSDDKQLQIMNSYIQNNDLETIQQLLIFILGYSLSTHQIIEYFIPIKSKECILSIDNPNYFILEERIRSSFSNEMEEKSQQKQLIIQLTEHEEDMKKIIFPTTYDLQNTNLIITDSKVYLNKIDFSQNRLKNVIIQNSNIYYCNNTILEGYDLISFSQCKFIQNCHISQQYSVSIQAKIQIKNVNIFQIKECEFINQKIDDLNSFLSIENFNQTSFSGFTIKSNKLSSHNSPFIYIRNGTRFTIENYNFTENLLDGQNVSFISLIQLILITSIQIQTVNIHQNALVNNNIIFLIFLLQGNQQILIKNVNYEKNINVFLLNSTNRVENQQLSNKNLIQVNDQSIELNNANILQNTIHLSDTSIIEIFSSQKLLITNCQLNYNYLPMANCISIKDVESIHILDTQINNNLINSVIFIEDNNQFWLRDIIASNNTSTLSGTILKIIQTSLDLEQSQSSQSLINYCIFFNNTAEYEGGVIYSKSVNYYILNSQFFKNQAVVGGAIKYEIIQPQFVKQKIKKNQRTLINIKNQNNTFFKNNSTFYGNDIGSYPLIAVINSNQAVDELRISNFKSGGNLDDLYIYILDDDGNVINFNFSLSSKNQNSVEYKKIQQLKDSLIIYASSSNQNELDLKDNTIFSYSQDNSFNLKGLKLLGLPNSTISSILTLNFPFLTSFDVNSEAIEGQQFIIPITFRPCQVGEVYVKISLNIYECLECSQSKYSLKIPIKDSNQICISCNQDGVQSCERNILVLKQGYWRRNESSDNPIQCYNQPSNCNGDPSSSYCIEGYIGPLCETCDNKGEKWGENFGRVGNYQCTKCSSYSKILSRQFIIALIIMTHLIISIRSVIVRSEKQIICLVLRKIDWVLIGTTGEFTRLTTLTKFLMSYIQIIQTIQLSDLKFFSEINQQLQQIFGNPIENMSNSLDCFFSEKEISGLLPLEFSRVIWNAIQPFILLTILLLIYSFYLLFNRTKLFQDKYTFIALTFGLLYFQSGVLSSLITTISCEDIDGIKYLKNQLNKECYTTEHMIYIFALIIPIFLFWSIIYPVLILSQIYRNRHQLYTPNKLQKLGFYYSEYRQQYYYWEFVRMGFRILLISLGNILTSQNQITWKFGLFSFILSLYGFIIIKVCPYKVKNHNEFDFQLTKITSGILILWFLSKLSIEISQKLIFSYGYYTLLMFSYILFSIYMIKAISAEGFTLKKITQTLCPKLYKKLFLQRRNRNPMRRFILWKRLKTKLHILYKFHKNNQNNLQTSTQSYKNDEIEEDQTCLFASSINYKKLVLSKNKQQFQFESRRNTNQHEKIDQENIQKSIFYEAY